MDWEKTHRLCDEIIRRGLKIEWVVETRLDRVNEELLRKMKRAGCKRIHYGLESGDPALFARVGKDGAADRMEKLIRNFRITERLGIHPHMFVLIGLLGETRESIGRTVAVMRRIKPLTLQVAIVTPYPGTPLYEEAKRTGLLTTEDWSRFTGFDAVLRTEALSTEALVEARGRILRAHRRAVFWKRQRHKAALTCAYLRDGSLWGRLARKMAKESGAGQ
jgi:anaerobic magnesium-protoporphyrin IX monomethyl ester cyclase